MTFRTVANAVAASWLAAQTFVPAASGQTVLATAYGNAKEYLGYSAAAGPDLDGDGIEDIAVGAIGVGTSSQVKILSGSDLHELKKIGSGADQFGTAVCWCGDLDGDGIPELAAGAPATGSGVVRIYSPATWTLYRTLQSKNSGDYFGTTLVNAGDVNGDGFDDLVVGAWGGTSNPGAAIVFSGADGSILFQMNGSYDGFGISIASIGDVDGDGISDLAVGAPSYDATTHSEMSGRVELFSGVDGSFLWQTVGTYTTYQDAYGVRHYEGQGLGVSLARIGDFDGDGTPDVVAGQRADGFNDILSGADGSILFQFGGSYGPITTIGDNDGDGRSDIALPYFGAPSGIYVRSGSDASVLWQTPFPSSAFLHGVSPIDDVNGDGRADLLIGNPTDSTNGLNAGSVQLIAIDDLWLNCYTRGLKGGSWISMSVRKGPPGNLSGIAITAVNGAPIFMLAGLATFDATGSSIPINAMVPTGLAGTTVDLRALAIDASGRLVHSRDELFTLF
jgi:hypothetical protein